MTGKVRTGRIIRDYTGSPSAWIPGTSQVDIIKSILFES